MRNLWTALSPRRSFLRASEEQEEPADAMRETRFHEEEPVIYSSAVTSAGVVRDANEDAIRVAPLDEREEAKGVLAVVADGMGGANAGECASSIARDLIPQI